MLTHARLVDVLDYNCDTGIFTWKKTLSVRAPIGSRAGSSQCRGYVGISIDGQTYRAHRLAWLYVYEKWPDGVIDHYDGKTDNNAILNLRDVPQNINTRNTGMSVNNKSGVKGVSWSAKRKKWQVHIMIDYRSINLGAFADLEEAARCRRSAEQGLGFINR